MDYRVVDSADNEGTATREVRVWAETTLDIILTGGDSLTIEQNDIFEDPGYEVVDCLGDDITSSVEVGGNVDYFRVGTYTLTYDVEDAFGNKGFATRSVEVVEGEPVMDHAIYLTFDDGPSDAVTPQILDILKENDVKATFFILKYGDSGRELVQREYDEGHTVACHGYSHDYAEIYTSADAFMENLNKIADMVYEDLGFKPFCMRFPGGSSNTVSEEYSVGIMDVLVKEVEDEGWMYLDWNVDSTDAEGNNRDPEEMLEIIEDELQENRRNVILMHDSSAKQTTADVLQSVIDYGKENGYRFYPVTEQTVPVQHNVAN